MHLRAVVIAGSLALLCNGCGSKAHAKEPTIGIDAPASSETPAGVGSAAPPNETAEVVTDQAIVRDAPNSSGMILARLPKGSKVNVLATAGAWINVAYGENGETGWTFHSSVGR